MCGGFRAHRTRAIPGAPPRPGLSTRTATKSSTAVAAAPRTTFEYVSTYPVTSCQLSPSAYPASTNTVFHTALPSVVSARNTGSGIRSIPAGTDIRLRKTGIMRPKKTAFVPCRANHASVRSMSAGFTSGRRTAIATIRSRPSSAPAPYSASAPVTEPMVVHRSAAKRSIRPVAEAKPARGRMTSLGSGGKRFSRATAMPAPGAPSVSMSPLIQPGALLMRRSR